MRTSRPSAGFSLLELIVVLAVLTAVAALVMPRIGSSPSADAAAAERLILAGLRQARSLAVTSGDSVAWVLDAERARMHLEPSTAVAGAGNARAPVRTLPAGVALELITAARERINDEVGRIRFFPDGSSTGGRVKTSAGGRTHWVDVDWLTGRIQVLVDDAG